MEAVMKKVNAVEEENGRLRAEAESSKSACSSANQERDQALHNVATLKEAQLRMSHDLSQAQAASTGFERALSAMKTDQANKAAEIKRLHEDLEKGKRDLIEKEMRFAREVERMGRVVKAQAGRLQQVGGQQQQHNPQPGGPGREEEREEEEEEEGSMAS